MSAAQQNGAGVQLRATGAALLALYEAQRGACRHRLQAHRRSAALTLLHTLLHGDTESAMHPEPSDRAPPADGSDAATDTATALTSSASGVAAASHRSLAEHLLAEDETKTYALLMPPTFVAKEGAPLWEGVRLGRFLGSGAQVC